MLLMSRPQLVLLSILCHFFCLELIFLNFLLLNDLVFQASAKIRMFFFGARMVDGWVTVLAQPVLNFVALRVQEVQDALHSILLREHLVMLFQLV